MKYLQYVTQDRSVYAKVIYTMSQKTRPTLASCSFNKRGLIVIIFGKQQQHTFKKMISLFNFPYQFALTYFVCF